MDDVWAELNELFDRLAEAPASTRTEVLDAETDRTPQLRRRVERMLAAHDLGAMDVERAVDRAFAEIDRPFVYPTDGA